VTIVFILLAAVDFQNKIDSLNLWIKNDPRADLVLQLNDLFLQAGQIDSAIALLTKFEPVVQPGERTEITFHLAENYLYRGRFLLARDKYLETVGRYARSSVANDALERLYLLETCCKDTILLLRLVRCLARRSNGDLALARDSLKNLLGTAAADHAYYYLGQFAEELGEPAEALAAFSELDRNFPDHNFHHVPLWEAELCVKLGEKKKAREILENLLVRDPASIYAGQAREMLKKIGL
jgi:tetratricopeptide (TPR) repeat protein